MIDLTGKVAIVTGGSRGIGRAVSLMLGRQGADVAFIDRAACLLDDHTKGDVEALGRRSICVGGDVTSPESCAETVEETLKAFGRIDILVNNAGITRDDLAMRMSDQAWADVLNVNLTGSFYMARAVLRPMLKQRSGRIINMSSVSGQMGNAGQANYSASKAGLIGLTKALAREVASRGITVNAVAPGFVPSHRAHRRAAGQRQGRDQGRHAAGPLRHRRRDRGCGHVPRLRRGRLHHGPGPGGRRRPRDDVAGRAGRAGPGRDSVAPRARRPDARPVAVPRSCHGHFRSPMCCSTRTRAIVRRRAAAGTARLVGRRSRTGPATLEFPHLGAARLSR